MKKLVTSYTFNAADKTITSSDFVSLDAVLLITNVTDNVIIYNFAGAGKGGTLAGTTLTLDYNTATMDNGDSLQIFVDDLVTPATSENQTTLSELVETLQELTARLDTLASMANSGAPALRVIPIASVSTAVTGSVTATVASTSITNFGTGIPAKEMADDINNYTAIVANINNVTA